MANGGIVVPLFELVGAPADPRNDELESRRRIEGCVPAAPALLEQIAANPAGYYVNLHNARFPAGAIRGQLDYALAVLRGVGALSAQRAVRTGSPT